MIKGFVLVFTYICHLQEFLNVKDSAFPSIHNDFSRPIWVQMFPVTWVNFDERTDPITDLNLNQLTKNVKTVCVST